MRAYLIHQIPSCGGGERVLLEAARALSESDVDVVFVVNSREAVEKCIDRFGVPVKRYSVVEVKSALDPILGLGGRFVRVRLMLMMRKIYSKIDEMKSDGITIDFRTNHPTKAHAVYLHYPILLTTYMTKGNHMVIYNWLVRRLVKGIEGKPKLVMANSSWTARIVKDLYGLNAHTVYPPVDVDYFRYDGNKKEKIIVTVSRISFEKNVHLIPRVASKLPDYTWYIVGSMGIGRGERRLSEKVIETIYREAEKHGARNIEVLPDLPREKLRDLLLRASFYVNPLYVEHFGIAVAEAMAAGAIPIVYRDGGAWFDVVFPVSDRLGYEKLEEIPQIIRFLEGDSNMIDAVRRRAIERVSEYSAENFRKNFIQGLRRADLI